MTGNVLRTLEHGLDVLLLCCNKEEGISLADIMEQMQLPRSTAYRMVGVLRDRGFLRATGTPGRYDLGHQLCHLARLAESRLNLGKIAHPFVAELVAEVQETALVTVRSGWKALCVMEVESAQAIRIRFNTNLALPLYAGATAKILLAFMSCHEQDKVLQSQLRAISGNSYLSKMKIRDDLKRIRLERVAVSCGEVHSGVVAVSVPIFSCDKQLLGGLAVTGTEARIPPERYAELTVSLRVAANEISEAFDKAAGLVD